MKFINSFKKKSYLLSLFIIIFLLILFFPLHFFIIDDGTSGIPIYSGLVSAGDLFEIRYIHSVEHMNVRGIFLINAHYKIEPIETIFPSYGAGMPFIVQKKDFFYKNGMMKIKHHDIELNNLRIFVSHITKQRIFFKNIQIELYKRIKDGGIAIITVKLRPLLFGLFY